MKVNYKSFKGLILDKRFGFICLSILFLMSILFMSYKFKIFAASNQKEDVIMNSLSEVPVGEITSGQLIEQSFISNNDNLIGLSLNLATYARENTGNLYVNLIELDTLRNIKTWEVDVGTLSDNTFQYFQLSNPIIDSNGNMYKITVYSKNAESGNAVTIWSSINDSYDSGQLYINGVLQEGDLAFGVNIFSDEYKFISPLYIFFTVLSILFVVIMGWLLFYKKNIPIEKYFLIMMIFLGILYMFVLPPFSTPDETAHYITSYKNSSSLLLKQKVDEHGFPLVREEDTLFYGINRNKSFPNKEAYLVLKENLLQMNESENVVSYPVKALDVSFLSHLPQSIGISIARILNLGNAPLFIMGKLANLLFYTLLVYYSIKKIPFGKMVLLAVSMLPMMLELTTSLSYDPVIAALSFLFISYCLNLIYIKDKICMKDVFILALIIACLSPLKVVYFMLVFLCVLFPINKFSKKRDYYIANILLISTALLSMLIVNLNTLSTNSQGNKLPWTDIPSYSVSDILQNPLRAIKIFINTIYVHLEMYIKTMIGSRLGWLNIPVSDWIILGFIIILILAAIKVKSEEINISNKDTLIFCFIIVSVSGLILLSMFVGWTPITYNVIEGVQGRYFLPILPLMLMLFKTTLIRLEKNIDKYLIFTLSILNILAVSEVFIQIIQR